MTITLRGSYWFTHWRINRPLSTHNRTSYRAEGSIMCTTRESRVVEGSLTPNLPCMWMNPSFCPPGRRTWWAPHLRHLHMPKVRENLTHFFPKNTWERRIVANQTTPPQLRNRKIMNQFRRTQVFQPEIDTRKSNPPIQNANGADLSRMYGANCTTAQTTKATDILSSFKRAKQLSSSMRSPSKEWRRRWRSSMGVLG